MNKTSHQEGLERRRFLSLLGKSALGLWLLQLIPSGLGLVKTPKKTPKREAKSANLYAARVKAHPLAVERTKQG